MTRLVNRDRDLIKASILADLPKVDYEEKIRARCLAVALSLLPPTAKRLWEDSSFRGLLATHSIYPNYDTNDNCYIAQSRVPGFEEEVTRAIRDDAEVKELCAASTKQTNDYIKLDSQLEANLLTCHTRESFRKRFPELAGYLPEIAKVTPEVYLPATTALIDGLLSAGLPIPKVAKAA